MQLPPEEVEKFRAIYKKEFRKEISYQEAEEAKSNLVNFFSLLIKIDREQN